MLSKSTLAVRPITEKYYQHGTWSTLDCVCKFCLSLICC